MSYPSYDVAEQLKTDIFPKSGTLYWGNLIPPVIPTSTPTLSFTPPPTPSFNPLAPVFAHEESAEMGYLDSTPAATDAYDMTAEDLFGPEKDYAMYMPVFAPSRAECEAVVQRICDNIEREQYENNPDVLNRRGLMLCKNPETAMKAIELFTQAAAHDHVEATFNLGYMYQQGMGIKDLVQAELILNKAIELGSLNAICALGDVYEERGLNEKAFNQYLEAAEKGHVGAIANLGTFLVDRSKPDFACKKLSSAELDTTVEQKEASAVRYFQQAGDRGNPGALFNLGWAYYEGDWGVPKNLSIALDYFKKSKHYFDAQGKTTDSLEATSYIEKIELELSQSAGQRLRA